MNSLLINISALCIEGLQQGCANLNINPSETIRKGDVLGKYNLVHPKEEWNLVFLIPTPVFLFCWHGEMQAAYLGWTVCKYLLGIVLLTVI